MYLSQAVIYCFPEQNYLVRTFFLSQAADQPDDMEVIGPSQTGELGKEGQLCRSGSNTDLKVR